MVSATTQVVLVGLAFYGLFFTSLPEQIVRQLRIDVADAKEELTDLRLERRQALGDLAYLEREQNASRIALSDARFRLDEMSRQLGGKSQELDRAVTAEAASRAALSGREQELVRLTTRTDEVEQARLRATADTVGNYCGMMTWPRIRISQAVQEVQTELDWHLDTMEVWKALKPAVLYRGGKAVNFDRRKIDAWQQMVDAGYFKGNFQAYRFGGRTAPQAEEVVQRSRSTARAAVANFKYNPTDEYAEGLKRIEQRVEEVPELEPVLVAYKAVFASRDYDLHLSAPPSAADPTKFDAEAKYFLESIEKVENTAKQAGEEFASRCSEVGESLRLKGRNRTQSRIALK